MGGSVGGDDRRLKPLGWIASSYKDLLALPPAVVREFGYALYRAQRGETADHVKALKGFSGASVLEVIEDFDGNAYRAIYTVRFRDIVYVLHVFQKKAKSGMATPKAEIEVVKRRLKAAETEYREWRKSEAGK
jgi:phage-related protein